MTRRRNQRKIGADYERLAGEHLQSLGYAIVEYNIYTPYGEVDILAEKDGLYYFFEVKYRSGVSYGSPKEAIHHKKLVTMKKTMLYVTKERQFTSWSHLGFVGITWNEGKLDFEVLSPLVF